MFKKRLHLITEIVFYNQKFNSIFKKLCKIDDSFQPQFKARQHFLDQIQQLRNEEGKKEDFPVSHSTKLTVPWATFHCLATVTSDITCVGINKSKTRLSHFDSLDFTSEY